MLWFLNWILLIWGTQLAFKKFKKQPVTPRSSYPPVSILKPLKGADEGLFENLKSFFEIDYPEYELIFSVTNEKDPAVKVVEQLLQIFPQRNTQLLFEKRETELNPKINNLLKAYEVARHEIILISDSNIRAKKDYLKNLLPDLTPQVGIITAVVAGTHASSLGGWLEASYLNTFLSRWMILTKQLGFPSVVGKSMIFRKETLKRLGGLKTLGSYIAEDYMAGHAIQKLDLKVEFMQSPIPQYIGNYGVNEFWARHVRWGRIRKSIAPFAFLIEPFFFSGVSGVLGASAASFFWQIHPGIFFAQHLIAWAILDLFLFALMDRFSWKSLGAWILRKALALPLWIKILLGNQVKWRGGDYRLLQGGLLAGEATP